ncbi:MAG: CinA family nicotinamide mononucleotide deamidase-related protein, partial [Myxococcota bacterium]
VALVCIGDELLDGRVRDANLHHLGAALEELGQKLVEARFVADDIAQIERALLGAVEVADVVAVSGGLGPTSDDITRDVIAGMLGEQLVRDAGELTRLKSRFAKRGYPFTENNARQCDFPTSARVLVSEVGTASGFVVELQGTTVLLAPGVPREFAWYVREHLVGMLRGEEREVYSETLHFFGLGESHLASMLEELEADAQAEGVKIGYRAAFPIISVTLKARTQHIADLYFDRILSELLPYYAGENDKQIFGTLSERLLRGGATVTTAESCTAGGVAAAVTDTPGSSAWFERGWVTYANEAKVELVGVDERVLARWGAVSAQAVAQMASGARERAQSTWSVAVSGIAGPGGASEEKPVGLVHFAVAHESGKTWHTERRFGARSRAQIRELSVATAGAMLLWIVDDIHGSRQDIRGPFTHEAVWSEAGIDVEVDG